MAGPLVRLTCTGLDGLVRSHVQHHVDVASYCYAGSQASLLRALFEDRRRPLFGQAREVTLPPIAPDAIAVWVVERLLDRLADALRFALQLD